MPASITPTPPERWYIEYKGHTPVEMREARWAHEWYRPSHVKRVVPGSGALVWIERQPIPLTMCIEWIAQYEDCHHERMRIVHAETGEVIPGYLIV